MSNLQKHTIQRVAVEVEINTANADSRQAEIWLNIVRDWVYSTLLPMLEEILGKMSLPNEMIRLDQLKLDLGELSEIHLKDFSGIAGMHIKQAIEEKVKAVREEQNYKRLSESQNTIEAFLFFLKTGRLPWWFTPRPLSEWEAQIMATFSEYREDSFQFPKDAAVSKRLIGHFSEVFFNKLLQKLFFRFYEKSIEIQGFVNKITVAAKFSLSKRKVVEYAVREILLRFFEQELPAEQLSMYVVNHLPERQFLLLRKVAVDLSDSNWKSEEEKRFIELFVTRKIQSIEVQFVDKQKNALLKDSHSEMEMRDEIYVSNAGLVLLHPFINYLFEELKISKNDKLMKPQRAAYLLQWLVNGQSNVPEYELPLNKLLCGIPLEEPLIGTVKLTKREKIEAQNLLEAAIRHWNALKNTSPAGLQANFLCRDGKLTQKQDGDWLLQVERKSIDILLDHLPWSISMIQLPWMTHWLWVEWA